MGGHTEKNIEWIGNIKYFGKNNDNKINAEFDGTINKDGDIKKIYKRGTWEILEKNDKIIKANFIESDKKKKLYYEWSNGNWGNY